MPRFLASELGAELEEARGFEWESECRSDCATGRTFSESVHSQTSRPALHPTQSPIQRILWLLSGYKAVWI